MKFSYRAIDARQKIKKGVIDAPNLREATKLLVSQGWYIKKISPRGTVSLHRLKLSYGGVSLIDRVLFAKHLSTMLKSGLTLHESLETIEEQSTSPRFKKVLADVIERVKSGQTLSASAGRYPKIFDNFFTSMVSVGEQSGTLEESLEYLAGELEERLELRRKIQAATLYPSIILIATFGLGGILAYFVLPRITSLFRSLDFELPLSTKILLFVSNALDQHGVVIFSSLAAAIIVLRIVISLKPIKPVWHWFLIKLPVVGAIVIHYNLANITRTLSILLKSGLTIDQALLVVTGTISNRVYRNSIRATLPQIEKGEKLSDSLARLSHGKRHSIYPLLVTRMIDVGERSGKLDESLRYLAEYFEKEVDATTKNLATILEPILLVVIGVIVGFIAISVITPIYDVVGRFRR